MGHRLCHVLAVLPLVLAAVLLGLRQGLGAPLWSVRHRGGTREALELSWAGPTAVTVVLLGAAAAAADRQQPASSLAGSADPCAHTRHSALQG